MSGGGLKCDRAYLCFLVVFVFVIVFVALCTLHLYFIVLCSFQQSGVGVGALLLEGLKCNRAYLYLHVFYLFILIVFVYFSAEWCWGCSLYSW